MPTLGRLVLADERQVLAAPSVSLQQQFGIITWALLSAEMPNYVHSSILMGSL